MDKGIILLFGGTSEERLVSVASAQNVAGVLKDAGLWFLSQEGAVYEVTHEALLKHQNAFTTAFDPQSKPIFPSIDLALRSGKYQDSTFFLALHGGEGEDGSLQKLLERYQIAFTASGADSSHKAFDKTLAKEIAKKAGVKVVESFQIEVKSESELTDQLTTAFKRMGAVILKPVAGGSSIGLYFVHSEQDIPKVAKSLAAHKGRSYLCETFVKGTELTIGVLDNEGRCTALPASEVRVDRDRQFDYEGKYLGKGTVEITPAEVSKEVMENAQQVALTMHKVLGCYGYSRTDVIYSNQGPVYLETNTLPGLTKRSFIPQQLDAAKISFSDFIEQQIRLAKNRY